MAPEFSMMPLWISGDLARLVGVRMGVRRGRRAVRGPAGVADADGARGAGCPRAASRGPRACRPPCATLRPLPLMTAMPGGVVPAVFQPPQPLEQERRRLPWSDVSDNSAHVHATLLSASAAASARQAAISCLRFGPVGASAINRTIGSVPEGRTWTQRSARPVAVRPDRPPGHPRNASAAPGRPAPGRPRVVPSP